MSRKRSRSGGEEFIGGATLILVFGLLFISTHQSFWLFPLCFAGIPPLLRGIQRIYSHRAIRREQLRQVPPRTDADLTKEILRVAQKNRGKITPAIVTLNSSLSLDEAERLLQDLASKGYAAMNVTDSGRIEYEFPEFSGESED